MKEFLNSCVEVNKMDLFNTKGTSLDFMLCLNIPDAIWDYVECPYQLQLANQKHRVPDIPVRDICLLGEGDTTTIRDSKFLYICENSLYFLLSYTKE